MSWQEYVDTSLIGSTNFVEAAIIGMDGGIWASSPGLALSNEDATGILAAFTDNRDAKAEGFTIGGIRYVFVRGDDHCVFLKKEHMGLYLVKTEQCVLVGLSDGKVVQGGAAMKTIEELGDYLLSVGY